MNGTTCMQNLKQIAADKAAAFASKKALLEDTQGMERKALAIAGSMAKQCETFVSLSFGDAFYAVRERRIWEQYHDFDAYRSAYDALEQPDREGFLVFAFAFVMVKHQLLDKRKTSLMETKDAQERFVSHLIVGVLEDILREWQQEWNKNGSFPCEATV